MEPENGFIEKEEPDGELEQVGGLSFAGPNGELDASAMLWRKARSMGFKERMGYRPAVPCDRCANCIEVRRFTETGKVQSCGYFCISGEIDTSPYYTCNAGKARKNGRKKVLYDLNNAPMGFEVGIGTGDVREVLENEGVRSEKVIMEYRGGSKPMARKEDDQMPRRLVN